MPRYCISATTLNSYYCVVDAPSREAAQRWYDQSDGGEFNGPAEEVGWELEGIRELGPDDNMTTDVTIDTTVCVYCAEELRQADGHWVDKTEGDVCSGNDVGVNENMAHVPDLEA